MGKAAITPGFRTLTPSSCSFFLPLVVGTLKGALCSEEKWNCLAERSSAFGSSVCTVGTVLRGKNFPYTEIFFKDRLSLCTFEKGLKNWSKYNTSR